MCCALESEAEVK